MALNRRISSRIFVQVRRAVSPPTAVTAPAVLSLLLANNGRGQGKPKLRKVHRILLMSVVFVAMLDVFFIHPRLAQQESDTTIAIANDNNSSSNNRRTRTILMHLPKCPATPSSHENDDPQRGQRSFPSPFLLQGGGVVESSLLNCHGRHQTKKRTLNFFSTAVKTKYEDFLPLYAFFALSIQEDAVVEMVVANSTKFIGRNRDVLHWLQRYTNKERPGSTLCVRDFSSNHSNRTKTTNTWRYLEVPVMSAKYTYISDIDILLTESPISDPVRFEQMRKFGLPYSNVIRPNTTRLTGIMLLETDKFYTEELMRNQKILDANGNDETFLYRLVNASGLGLPDGREDTHNSTTNYTLATYRPLHGVHLSFNRGPGKKLCLSGEESYVYLSHALSMPRLEDFFCSFQVGYHMLDSFVNTINEELQYNMTLQNGTCQGDQQLPNNNTRTA